MAEPPTGVRAPRCFTANFHRDATYSQRNRNARKWAASGLTICVLCCGGCLSVRQSIPEARQAFAVGRADEAAETLVGVASRRKRDHVPAALDLAMVQLAAGDHQSAEMGLRKLRDDFDRQPAFAAIAESTSLVTDDNTRPYRPSGYVRVMIRVMLTMCSLAGDAIDAESYSLQAEMTQRQLARQAESRGLIASGLVADAYQPVAITPYLRGVLRESNHRDYDDAAKAYRLVSQVRPDFLPAAEDIRRASGATHSSPGHGVLYVIALVGRGPVLRETEAETTSTALSIASSVLNAESDDADRADREEDRSSRVAVLPNLASVKVPVVDVPDSPIRALGTIVNGQTLGATQTLTDIATLACQQSQAEMPWAIARAVVRRATKESLVVAARRKLNLAGDWGRLFHFAAATAWSASESADLRCWGLLPREIQVLRAELPVGEHEVQLSPLGIDGRPLGPPTTRTVSIRDGHNDYLIAIAPERFVYAASQSRRDGWAPGLHTGERDSQTSLIRTPHEAPPCHP